MKVVDKLWFTTMKGTVGLVIIEEDNTHDRKGYIGAVGGQSEEVDTEELLAWGHKFSLCRYSFKPLRAPPDFGYSQYKVGGGGKVRKPNSPFTQFRVVGVDTVTFGLVS